MRGAKPSPETSFSIEVLPRLSQVPTTTLAQLQEGARRFTESVKAREAAEEARRVSKEGRVALQAEIGALQLAVHQVTPRRHPPRRISVRSRRDRFWSGLVASPHPRFTGC
jgi:hypothetical protein